MLTLRVVKNPIRGASIRMWWSLRGTVSMTTVRLGGALLADGSTGRPLSCVRDLRVPKVRVCVMRIRR